MLYEYILKTYQKDEPIFLSEIPGYSRDYLRQEMKRLTDEGKLERLYNGVYYISYTTILGTKGRVSVEKYIKKRYLLAEGVVSGYVTGMQLANEFGFTTQNPAYCEICTNEATTKQRKTEVDGRQIVIYKPIVQITEKNKSALQFLDLMCNLDRYSEIKGEELREKIRQFVNYLSVDFEIVKEMLPLYPDKVYRNIYEGGIMSELV